MIKVADFREEQDGGDWSPAFQRAIASLPVGGRIEVPAGKLRLAATVQRANEPPLAVSLSKPIILCGEGGSEQAPVTILEPDAGVVAIVVESYGSGRGNGAGSRINDIAVICVPSAAPCDAIEVRSVCWLSSVTVFHSSRHGVDVYGDVTKGSNVAQTRLDDVRGVICAGDAIHIAGQDANVITTIGCSGRDGGGYGIYDNTFLGNVHISAHANANAAGPYKSPDANARSTWVGAYSEGGGPPADIRFPAVVVGGLQGAGNVGGAQTIGAGKSSPAATYCKTPWGDASIQIGDGAPSALLLSVTPPQVEGEPLRYPSALQFVREDRPSFAHQGDWWGVNFASLDGAWSVFFPMGGATVNGKPAGHAPLFPQGVRTGRKASRILTWAPQDGGPPHEGVWSAGDVLLFHYAHEAGFPWSGYAGAHCTRSGDAAAPDPALRPSWALFGQLVPWEPVP
jgi:hypothetical protein